MLDNSKRVNLNLPDDLVKSYDDMARKMCVPRSALITIALVTYLDNKVALDTLGNMKALIAEIEIEQNKKVKK